MACGESIPDLPEQGTDAGVHADVDGGMNGADGGAQGGNGDAGLTETACSLGEAERITEVGPVTFELDAFAATEEQFAIALRRIGTPTERTLRLIPRTGEGTVLRPSLTGISEAFIPVSLDVTPAGFLIAGNDESSGSPVGHLAWIDAAGQLGEKGSTAGRRLLGAVGEDDGARTLALQGAEVVSDRYNGVGAHTERIALAPAGRDLDQWSIARRESDGRMFACGYTRDGGNDLLTVFELSGSTVTPRASTHAIAPEPGGAETARFTCRIALGVDFAAVAVAESGGRPRLVWFDDEGRVIAGPVPFLPEHATGPLPSFDIAVNGDNTAVALFDSSTGASRIVVRVFSGPGFAPVDVDVSSDLNLGTFDPPRRVRLANVDDGFAVAFDARFGNKTEIHYRPVSCTP